MNGSLSMHGHHKMEESEIARRKCKFNMFKMQLRECAQHVRVCMM